MQENNSTPDASELLKLEKLVKFWWFATHYHEGDKPLSSKEKVHNQVTFVWYDAVREETYVYRTKIITTITQEDIDYFKNTFTTYSNRYCS